MDGLRWLLLISGVLLIVGIYLFSRYQKNKPDSNAADESRREPTLGHSPELPHDEPATETPVVDAADSPDAPVEVDTPQEAPQNIVTLRLVAKARGSFKGDELILSLRGIGMRHGRFGIFHRYDGANEDAVIFSAASLVEPGSFDLTNIKDQQIPGISLFMVLPGPVEGAEAFDMMMEAARALTQSLNGELLDESGSTLSIQRERYIREEIIQFEHSVNVV